MSAKISGKLRQPSGPATVSPVVPKGLERIESELHHGLVRHVAPAASQQEEKEQTAAFYLDRGRRLMDETRDQEANGLPVLAHFAERAHELLEGRGDDASVASDA